MAQTEGTLKIKSIKNGIVIDHIPGGRAPDVLRILGIDTDFKYTVALAMNVSSKNLIRKDIVKVENRDIETEEINKITIVAPDATVNIIRNFEVVKKQKVRLPESIVGILRCPNPKCITNKEREPVRSQFEVRERNPLVLCCRYCEREIRAPTLLF